MRCPVDNETLVMADRGGVEIDYCPKCRGVWLDRGELDKIIERAGEGASPAKAAPAAKTAARAPKAPAAAAKPAAARPASISAGTPRAANAVGVETGVDMLLQGTCRVP